MRPFKNTWSSSTAAHKIPIKLTHVREILNKYLRGVLFSLFCSIDDEFENIIWKWNLSPLRLTLIGVQVTFLVSFFIVRFFFFSRWTRTRFHRESLAPKMIRIVCELWSRKSRTMSMSKSIYRLNFSFSSSSAECKYRELISSAGCLKCHLILPFTYKVVT